MPLHLKINHKIFVCIFLAIEGVTKFCVLSLSDCSRVNGLFKVPTLIFLIKYYYYFINQ